MARCTAPVLGHRSASAVAACPACAGRYGRNSGYSSYTTYGSYSSSSYSSSADYSCQSAQGPTSSYRAAIDKADPTASCPCYSRPTSHRTSFRCIRYRLFAILPRVPSHTEKAHSCRPGKLIREQLKSISTSRARERMKALTAKFSSAHSFLPTAFSQLEKA